MNRCVDTPSGITNVFDRDPAVNLSGICFGSGLYGAIGRAFYAGFNYKLSPGW